MFFRKFFNKKEYSISVEDEELQCSHCEVFPHEIKKCQDCGSKNICKECYKNELILCKPCDEKYNQWADKIQETQVQAAKEKKYGRFTVVKYSNPLMSGQGYCD